MDEAGGNANGLDGAQNAMRDAENALGQGQAGTGEAVDAQGRAVEALREGRRKSSPKPCAAKAKAMVRAQRARTKKVKARQANLALPRTPTRSGGRREASGRSRPSARFDPMGVPAAERARRVLEELRRRLGEPARPREEMDYLERLLRRY